MNFQKLKFLVVADSFENELLVIKVLGLGRFFGGWINFKKLKFWAMAVSLEDG
jgi:hypothetical protein